MFSNLTVPASNATGMFYIHLGTGLFGNSVKNTATTGLFGNNNINTNVQPSFMATKNPNQPIQGINQNPLFGTPKPIGNQPATSLFGQPLNAITPNMSNQGLINPNMNMTGNLMSNVPPSNNVNTFGFNTPNNQANYGNNLQLNNTTFPQNNNMNLGFQNQTVPAVNQIQENSINSLFNLINPNSGKLTNYQI
jgi:hypothetical protein